MDLSLIGNTKGTIAAASRNNTIGLWDVATRQPVAHEEPHYRLHLMIFAG